MSGEKKTYSPKNTDFAGVTAFVADYANHREETNHLGNVLTVVSDRKIGVEDQGNPGTVEYYEADVVSAQDYYPFGMIMPGRSVSAGEYRYGFNSMEQDDEWSVTGGHLDFGARIYDSRLGRWLNPDPKKADFPDWSPYNFAEDNPIYFIDPDGEAAVAHKKGDEVVVKAQLNFYGNEASPELANEIATDVQRQFNQNNDKVEIDGEAYPVRFEVRGTSHSENEILEMAQGNENHERNFIRIEEVNPITDGGSSGVRRGKNSGFFQTRDNLVGDNTAAHEFMHLLGLAHGDRFDQDVLGSLKDGEAPPMIMDRVSVNGVGSRLDLDIEPGDREVKGWELDKTFEGKSFDENDRIEIGDIENTIYGEDGDTIYDEQQDP